MRTSLQIHDPGTLLALKNSLAEMGLKGRPRLLSNNIIKTPMLVGLFKPFLILPGVAMSERELSVILKHELTHLKRRDLWVKSLTLVANAIHWFNPAAYRLTKNIDTFCELSWDEQVVFDMNREERKFYGETILNILGRVVNHHLGLYATLFVIAAALCFTGFAVVSLMNVTGGMSCRNQPLSRRRKNRLFRNQIGRTIVISTGNICGL